MPAIPPINKSIEGIFEKPKLERFKGITKPPSHQKSTSFWMSIALWITLLAIGIVFKISFSSVDHPLVYLKGPAPDFVGRKDYLRALYKDLIQGYNLADYRRSVKTKILWGKGGFGKSELAIQFANQNLHHFSLIWTFYCDSLERVNQGYRDLAEKLGVLEQDISPEALKERVHFQLENTPFKLPWLLIFDNVESDLQDYPQRGGGWS